jgi:hypothetical protein
MVRPAHYYDSDQNEAVYPLSDMAERDQWHRLEACVDRLRVNLHSLDSGADLISNKKPR